MKTVALNKEHEDPRERERGRAINLLYESMSNQDGFVCFQICVRVFRCDFARTKAEEIPSLVFECSLK